MSSTVIVNNLTLSHKGSNGVSAATIPDVCKTPTPGGPVPIPYPNISMSSDLKNGSTTVKADGNMISIKGSEYSRSTGDEPGTAGGVKSSTNMKESKWILYSFDVKIDGANACRLTDKKTHNQANTLNVAGDFESPPVPPAIQDIVCSCQRKVNRSRNKNSTCAQLGSEKHACCEEAIKKHNAEGKSPKLGGERGYDANGSQLQGNRAALADAGQLPPGSLWPDACIVDANGNPQQLVEFKFKCPAGTKIRKGKNGRWIRSRRSKQHPGWGRGRGKRNQRVKYKALGAKMKPKVTKAPILATTAGCS